MGYSIDEIVNIVSQPTGGYLRPSSFEKYIEDDRKRLNVESIPSSITGIVVDWLTRFIMGIPKNEAFEVDRLRYNFNMVSLDIVTCFGEDDIPDLDFLLSEIVGLDETSIRAACKIVAFDSWYRKPVTSLKVDNPLDITASPGTVSNIAIMVFRCLNLWSKYGPILMHGFSFDGGYTDKVSSGVGDYLTDTTIWKFNAYRYKPLARHTLQLLIWYIMWKHSVNSEYMDIRRLGVINPRRNIAYIYYVDDISLELIELVEKDIIGY